MSSRELLEIKGALSEMPEAEQAKIKECADTLRKIIAEAGDDGIVALAIVAMEMDE